MEIKLKVDTPATKIDFEFGCSEAETQMLIQDPAYQNLCSVIVEQLRLGGGHWRDMRDNNRKDKSQYQQPRDDWRKAYGDIQRQVQLHNKAVDTAIDQINRMIERIIRNTDTRS